MMISHSGRFTNRFFVPDAHFVSISAHGEAHWIVENRDIAESWGSAGKGISGLEFRGREALEVENRQQPLDAR